MKNSLGIVYPPISAVKPSPNAARHHGPRQRQKLKSLVTKFGQIAPIIVDANNIIIDGHLVYETLLELGYEEIAVVVASNRTDGEIRALRLALNLIASRWNGANLVGNNEMKIDCRIIRCLTLQLSL